MITAIILINHKHIKHHHHHTVPHQNHHEDDHDAGQRVGEVSLEGRSESAVEV